MLRKDARPSSCARLAPSFVRFGSFEHWTADNGIDGLPLLADRVIDRF